MTTARESALIAEVRWQLRDAPGAVLVEGPDGTFWAVRDDFDVQVHGEIPGYRDFQMQSWTRRTIVLTMATADLGGLIEATGKFVEDPTLRIEGVDFLVRDDQPRRKDDGLLCQLLLVEGVP